LSFSEFQGRNTQKIALIEKSIVTCLPGSRLFLFLALLTVLCGACAD
jgi:hypothetical protein